MRRTFLLSAMCWRLAAAPSAPAPNTFLLRVGDGAGEIEWITPCAIRVARYWGKAPAPGKPVNPDVVEVARTDRGGILRLKSECLTVDIEKATLRLVVSGRSGSVLADASPPLRTPRGFVVERAAPPGEQYFGLGPRAATSANLRGQRVTASKPLLVSSLGYGEFFPYGGSYDYDLAAASPDRRRVNIRGPDHLEYLFYFGPTPREILIEHARIMGTFAPFGAEAFRVLDPGSVPGAATRIATRGEGTWTSLAESVRSVVHASWSGLLVSALDFSPYEGSAEPLLARAAQLFSAVPLAYISGPRAKEGSYAKIESIRRQLTPYLFTCAFEARQLGVPMVRPVALQSPGDLRAAGGDTSEFMLGDALLVAPILTESAERSVYLPAGTWTRIGTGEVHKGRQTIRLKAADDELPLFAKHVSVLPLASLREPGLLVLHHFLGYAAEYLLMEEDSTQVSQFHAAPAGDLLRLEIESAKERAYEWVIHHAGPCGRVALESAGYSKVDCREQLKPGTWCCDPPSGRIRIRCTVGAGRGLVILVARGVSPAQE